MRWKDLTIGKKLAVGFGLLIISLACVAYIAVSGAGQITANAHEVIEGHKIRGEMIQREVDHLKWVSKVNAFVTDDSIATLDVALDPTKCGLGKFLYGEKRKNAEAFLPDLKPHFHGMEAPHKELHASAVAVQKAYDNASGEDKSKAAYDVYASQTLGALKKVQGKLADVIGLVNKNVQTDEEMKASAARTKKIAAIWGLLAIVVGIIISIVINLAIKNPVNIIVSTLKNIATGDLTVRSDFDSKDEIGTMSEALNHTAHAMQDALSSIGENAKTLAAAAEEMTVTTNQMSGNAEETSSQAELVSAAATQITASVDSVATAAEEMSATISEISKNAVEAARISKEGVQTVETANLTIQRLGESSDEIGNVINLISSVAEQTNLLALNATIEAARAGDAGKGFAVVANEVKELAKETARATEEIGKKIEVIQEDSVSAVRAIQEFSDVIKNVNDISSTIASAVEEQSSTTSEITRNVSEAAKGTSEIAQNITGVAKAAEDTSSSASDTQSAVTELAKMSSNLQELVSRFKY